MPYTLMEELERPITETRGRVMHILLIIFVLGALISAIPAILSDDLNNRWSFVMVLCIIGFLAMFHWMVS